MPNKDNLRLWVAALRSGDYEQGTETLHNKADNTWCCLGVACDVARRNGLELSSIPFSDDACGDYEWFDSQCEYLPPSVKDWLGVPNVNPQLGNRSAIDWNDFHYATFEYIADLIETEYDLVEAGA